MLVRLFYVSTAVGPQTTTVTGSILEIARKNNSDCNITGVLCQGNGLYLQILEGPRNSVNKLLFQIEKDPRHTRLELLTYEHIAERQFAHWSMAVVDLSTTDPMVLMNHPEFDPYSASGVTMAQNMVDLLASKIDIH